MKCAWRTSQQDYFKPVFWLSPTFPGTFLVLTTFVRSAAFFRLFLVDTFVNRNFRFGFFGKLSTFFWFVLKRKQRRRPCDPGRCCCWRLKMFRQIRSTEWSSTKIFNCRLFKKSALCGLAVGLWRDFCPDRWSARDVRHNKNILNWFFGYVSFHSCEEW
jgi:hypothetical protein